MNIYKVKINVEGVEDEDQNMYRDIDLTKLRRTSISLQPYKDIEEELNVMMA